MRALTVSRPVAWAYVACAGLLGLSGVMQMPIASRYRIAQVPGLGWMGDFLFTHRLHSLGAVLLLALAGYVAARWLRDWRKDQALSAWGRARAVILALLIASGVLRVFLGLPGVFVPVPTRLVDWTHLGLAAALGILALARLVARGRYLRAPDA